MENYSVLIFSLTSFIIIALASKQVGHYLMLRCVICDYPWMFWFCPSIVVRNCWSRVDICNSSLEIR
jgi:hypothetical protein